jgi:hypothetical protein
MEILQPILLAPVGLGLVLIFAERLVKAVAALAASFGVLNHSKCGEGGRCGRCKAASSGALDSSA